MNDLYIMNGYCPGCGLDRMNEEMRINMKDLFECPRCHLQILLMEDNYVCIVGNRGLGQFKLVNTSSKKHLQGKRLLKKFDEEYYKAIEKQFLDLAFDESKEWGAPWFERPEGKRIEHPMDAIEEADNEDFDAWDEYDSRNVEEVSAKVMEQAHLYILKYQNRGEATELDAWATKSDGGMSLKELFDRLISIAHKKIDPILYTIQSSEELKWYIDTQVEPKHFPTDVQ